MPLRMLRPGIITSDAVNQLSAPAEVFYRRLMSVVDDFGRYDGRVSIIRPACYPLQLDRVQEGDLTGWLNECESVGLILVYVVNGKPYVQMLKWDKPRAKSSKWPEPPANVKAHVYTCMHMRPESDTESESETDTESSTPLPPKRGDGAVVQAWFDAVWVRYPNKDGKKAAERHFKASVKSEADLARINRALENYLASDNVKRGFVKNGSTWFNNWVDWVDYTPVVKPEAVKPGSPGYVITDVDRVIAGYRNAKGIPADDEQFRTVLWNRMKGDAKTLLDYFAGDWRAAVECIAETAKKCAGWDWGWKAVMGRAPEFKNQGGRREPVRS